MCVIFNFWNHGDGLVIVYSMLQVAVGLYSIGLTFGDVPLQIVLLYVKLYVRWVLFFCIGIATVMITVTIGIYFYDSSIKSQGMDLIINQIYLNGPELVFMWPFLFYLDDLSTYIGSKYPNFYKGTTFWGLISKFLSGEIQFDS